MEARIRELLSGSSSAAVDAIDYFREIGSTNEYLLRFAAPTPDRFRACIAGRQQAGRGQHGRRWQSPPGAGLYLSIACSFAERPERLPAFSLVVGVAVAQALTTIGCRGIGLKWPNDIVAGDGKAGGILCEVHPASGASDTVVAGIGLNIDLDKAAGGQPVSSSIGRATDLRSCCATLPVIEELAAAVLDGVVHATRRFAEQGIAPFVADWRTLDWLAGRNVDVVTGGTSISGKADGIDEQGALLVRTARGLRMVSSGSVCVSG